MIRVNPLALIDAYKADHVTQYIDGTEEIYSNMTPRSNKYAKSLSPHMSDKVVHFNLQGLLIAYVIAMNEQFFNLPKDVAINQYRRRMDKVFGKGVINTKHIENLHDLGYLPLFIKSLPEGSLVNMKIPVMTIRNTLPEFSWMVNHIESMLSNMLWKSSTVATISYSFKRLLYSYAVRTGTDLASVDYQLHDFSYRGTTGTDDACFVGAGHLTSFLGSDTIPASEYIEDYYCFTEEDKDVSYSSSIPATEHSVMSLGIAYFQGEDSTREAQLEAERKLFKELLTVKYPTGMLSVVSDTYNLWDVLTKVVPSLKDEILARENGKLVCRPDCYSEDTSILTTEGWKPFPDLKETDMVAQVLDNGSYEFVYPTQIIDAPYEGEMVSFKDHHGKVDLLVTPNHRMVLEQNGKERIVFAEKLKAKGNHFQKMTRSAKSNKHSNKTTDIQRLKIAFQADGSYVTKSNNYIRFSFSKKRKILRMQDLLIRSGLQYKEYQLSDGKVEIQIKTNAANFSKDFDWINFSEVGHQWANDFIDELSHWDSSIRNEGRFKFDTTNKKVIDKVELIAIAAGRGVFITETEDNRQPHFSNVHTAHIMIDNKIGGQSWKKTVVDYSGRVYCVKVPSGKVLVKRNRCTMVSGNSGDPVKIITGYRVYECDSTTSGMTKYSIIGAMSGITKSHYEAIKMNGLYWKIDKLDEQLTEEEIKGGVELLWETFGGTLQTGSCGKEYKLLDSHIGMIYGDSITLERADQILTRLADKGFASGNVVLGVGSFSYQMLSRDTYGYAMKATNAVVRDSGIALFKDPITDNGVKKSAQGLLRVEKVSDNSPEGYSYVVYEKQTEEQEKQGELKPIFKDGQFVNLTSFQQVKDNISHALNN